MFTAEQIIQKYISFFEKRGHKRIPGASLIPENDPTTLFTSSGMQPLVPYLLGQEHPAGKRLVNVQNSFRAQDIDEVGDNRHTTFFRMLGNWSLGNYFKKEQLPWVFEFLTDELGLDPQKLFVTVFAGNEQIPKDTESIEIWKELFAQKGIDAKEGQQIFTYGVEKNWWSRSGIPDAMPAGEPGGPDSEVFYDFGEELKIHENSPYKNQKCHVNCDCGRFLEIGNSVFMQYIKQSDGSFKELPQRNVDFGGGLERLLAASENQQDIFQTSLFTPIIRIIEVITKKIYTQNASPMRIIADHFLAATFITASGVTPSNKEQGYILRRLIRRGLDNFYKLGGASITPILEAIVGQYKETDPDLVTKYEHIRYVIVEEENKYKSALEQARKFIVKKYKDVIPSSTGNLDSRFRGNNRVEGKKQGDELLGVTQISAADAFTLYTTHGLSPTQIKSLGYTFDDQAFAKKMEEHQKLSKKGAAAKFKGGLADTREKTIMGHTATHLLHQALRDVLGNHVHQTGSNITTERVRFDFNFERKLTDEELKKVEDMVNEKITENLPVHFEMIPTQEAKKMGAIGLFEDTYANTSKIYFIGGSSKEKDKVYSVEFCGGPHVEFTSKLKSFKIIKQESIGVGKMRIYAKVG